MKFVMKKVSYQASMPDFSHEKARNTALGNIHVKWW